MERPLFFKCQCCGNLSPAEPGFREESSFFDFALHDKSIEEIYLPVYMCEMCGMKTLNFISSITTEEKGIEVFKDVFSKLREVRGDKIPPGIIPE